MRRLSHTGIEYAVNPDGSQGYGWTIYRGCLHKQQGVCPVKNCWAEAMSKRGKWDFRKPELIPENLLLPLSNKKPARILVNFMGDLFGDWVDPEKPIGQTVETGNALTRQGWRICADVPLRRAIFTVAHICPQHTFIFLTKAPQNLSKWGKFPDNCWVGASVTDQPTLTMACDHLGSLKAKHKWLSIEPLLKSLLASSYIWQELYLGSISWVVIGAQSNPEIQPENEWVDEITAACEMLKIPVFFKDNMKYQGGRLSWKQFPEDR